MATRKAKTGKITLKGALKRAKKTEKSKEQLRYEIVSRQVLLALDKVSTLIDERIEELATAKKLAETRGYQLEAIAEIIGEYDGPHSDHMPTAVRVVIQRAVTKASFLTDEVVRQLTRLGITADLGVVAKRVVDEHFKLNRLVAWIKANEGLPVPELIAGIDRIQAE